MTVDKPPRPPKLGRRARRLWDEVTGRYELRPDEAALLEDACREVDVVDRLEAALAGAPLTVEGSQGQDRPHPLLMELRGHRLTLARLLRDVGLPDPSEDTGEAREARTVKARRAARARWGDAGARRGA